MSNHVNVISYDESIEDLLDEIETKLDQIRQLRGPEREHTLRTTQDLVKECRKKHHSLKVEIRSLPKDEKSIYDRKAKAHYEKMQELSNAILKLKSEDTADDGGLRDEIRKCFLKLMNENDARWGGRCPRCVEEQHNACSVDLNELLQQREKLEEIDRKLDEQKARARKKLILCFLFLLVLGIVLAIIFS